MIVLRKSFYIHWSAGRSPRVHEVNPGRDPSEVKSRVASTRPQSAHPPSTISGASSSSALSLMSTSPLKRMERRIKGWFKCNLGKHKQLDHRLSRLESHILRGEPTIIDDPPPDLEGHSDKLNDCAYEDAFSSTGEEEDEEQRYFGLE